VDEQLRRAVRDAGDDPDALAKAVAALERSGDLVAAARLLRGACDRAGAAVDLLTPPSIDALEPSVEPHRALDDLEVVAWWPDERGLWVRDTVPGDAGPVHEVLAWPLGGAATRLLAPRDLPPPPARRTPAGSKRPYTSAERRLHRVSGLVATADGRLAFSGASVSVAEDGELWYVLEPATGEVTHGPALAPLPAGRKGWGPAVRVVAGWSGVVVGGADGALLAWRLDEAAPPTAWLQSAEVAEGTCVVLHKAELRFHRLGEKQPFARQPSPVPTPKGWSGVAAASSGRVVVCDQDARELILIDSLTGELGRAPIPRVVTSKKSGALARIVAVRPCPSGRVVAVRFERLAEVALVDLRSGEGRLVALEHTPGEVAWSPTGRALAVPSQGGVLQVLTASGA
jgi:hypothetical protein